jgi:D-tyrosyl-tRNA(Tyr) deacylase
MRAVVQRAKQAQVKVSGEIVGSIAAGLVVLVGVQVDDTPADADYLAAKIPGLRIFDDEAGKMNWDLAQINGQLLVISQFTLLGDCRKGKRPSFIQAAAPELGRELYEYLVQELRRQGWGVATGRFGADMQVTLTNDGPVTLWLDSRKLT